MVIPTGASSTTVTLTAINDESLEGLEAPSLAIATGQYVVGSQNSASTKFIENESATFIIILWPFWKSSP